MTRENPGSFSLVERLRMRPDSDCREAADRIEELESQLRNAEKISDAACRSQRESANRHNGLVNRIEELEAAQKDLMLRLLCKFNDDHPPLDTQLEEINKLFDEVIAEQRADAAPLQKCRDVVRQYKDDAEYDENTINRLRARIEELEAALREIAALDCAPFVFPADWQEQIDACSECQRYKDHPIQRGICDQHRKPIYARERHNEFETKAIGYRAKEKARAALAAKEMK